VRRVDGGMTASLRFCWTPRSNRPMIQESADLGATCFAGLAAGVYPEPSKFANNCRLEHRFKSAMSAATRERTLAGWARAVMGLLASDEGEGVGAGG
jgi:glycerol kinase